MGKVVQFDSRPAKPSDKPTCRWGELHEMKGTMRVAEHDGLTVLLFVDEATGKTFVIGEKFDA